MNRWLVVLGAILIQLCLGAIYAWSVFTPYVIKPPYGFSATQSQIIFSGGLASFAFVMILAGRMQTRFALRLAYAFRDRRCGLSRGRGIGADAQVAQAWTRRSMMRQPPMAAKRLN